MNFRYLEFFLKEAFFGLSRNRLMAAVSVGTIFVSLVIYGICILGLYNVYTMLMSIQSRLDIMVYVRDDTESKDIIALKTNIYAYKGVKSVELITKEDAWKDFQGRFGASMKLIGGGVANPLPDTLKIKAVDMDHIEDIVRHIRTFREVEDVRYGLSAAQRLKQLLHGLQTIGLVLVLLFVIATLLIIVNTIRLTVLARQNEIVIMQLVGATDSFIRWPFIIEGIILGLAGATLASMMLRVFYGTVITNIAIHFPFLGLVTGGSVLKLIYTSVIVVGTFLGMLGGYISVTKSLKMSYNK